MNSGAEEEEQPRRSARARKSVVKFSVPTTESKRQRTRGPKQKETEAEAMELDGMDSDDDDDGQDPSSSEDEFQASRRVKAAAPGRQRQSKGGPTKTTSRRRSKKAADQDGTYGKEPESRSAPAGDYTIATDNNLFETVRHSASALELTVDEWVDTYQRSNDEADKGPPLAELINFTLRCSGCSESVDEHEVLDLDGAIDKTEEIQDTFKKVAQAAYPLISRSKQLKHFRSSLSEFMTRLVSHAHTSLILYDELFSQTFQAWLVAATSSRLRSFRHTSTVLVLEFISGLCSVASDVDQAFSKASRQREGEASEARGDGQRLRHFESNVNQLHDQKASIEGYISELLSSVFVHRYRDAEPVIRLECIAALGHWMLTYPPYFLQGSHLRYLGWVLTDSHKDVRLEAVKALDKLYSEPENIGMLQLFTERFKGRFVEMAASEPELPIRRVVISVLASVDKHGLLEVEQQQQLSALIFHIDEHVRRAVAPYFLSRVKEETQELLESNEADDDDDLDVSEDAYHARTWFKCFARLLVAESDRLDTAEQQDFADAQDSEGQPQLATSAVISDIASTGLSTGRFGSALAAAWNAGKDTPIKNWQALADYLLLDHTAGQQKQASQQQPPSSASSASQNRSQESHKHLTEKEETALVEVLVSSLSCTKSDAEVAAKKLVHRDDEPDVVADMTRSLINLIPRLFEKYHAGPTRLINVLRLPLSMNLELYLDMRMTESYEALWQDIIKAFVEETHSTVIESAFQTIVFLQSCGPLSDINESKLQECESKLCSQLRDTASNIDLTSSNFSPDQLRQLTASITRLHLVYSRFDVTSSLQDDGGQQYTSIIAIVDALVDRGQQCDTEEAKLVTLSINVLFNRLLWVVRGLKLGDPDTAPQETEVQIAASMRDDLVDKLSGLAITGNANSPEDVRRSTFVTLLNTLIMMHNLGAPSPMGRARDEALAPLRLTPDEESQYRCAGFVEAQTERLATFEAQVMDEGIEDAAEPQPGQSNLPRDMAVEHSVRAVLGTFAAALVTQTFSIRHAAVLLPFFGRGNAFVDELCRKLVEKLKDEGLFNDQGTATLVMVLTKALTEALKHHISTAQQPSTSLVELGKLCGSATTAYKGITVVKKLPGDALQKLHCDVIDFTLAKVKSLDSEDDEDRDAERGAALDAFKALILMLRNVAPAEAQKIQSHLHAALSSQELEVESSEAWEAEQAYDKRLSTAVAKLNGSKRTARKARDDKDEGADDHEGSDAAAEKRPRKSALKKKPKPTPAPAPTRERRPRGSNQRQTYAEADDNEHDDPAAAEENGSEPEPESSDNGQGSQGRASAGGSPSRKRQLEEDEEDEKEAEVPDQSQLAESLKAHEAVGDALPSRKRVRR